MITALRAPLGFERAFNGDLWVPDRRVVFADRRRMLAPLVMHGMRRIGGTTVYLSNGHNLTNAPAVITAAGTSTFSVNRRCRVNVRGIAGGAGATLYDAGAGHSSYGGGGGGGGSYSTGTLVDLLPAVIYAAVVGAGGIIGLPGVATAGGSTFFRINAGTIYLELGGGQPGAAFDGTFYPGGAPGVAVTGSNLSNGGAGGRGGSGNGVADEQGANGTGNGGGGGGGTDGLAPTAGDGGDNAYGSGATGSADPVPGNGGLGFSGGSPLSGNTGAGGGGVGSNGSPGSTPGFDGYIDITLVSIL